MRARAHACLSSSALEAPSQCGSAARKPRMSEEKSTEELQSAEKAAAKIQAGFRGYRVRKRLQEERKAKDKRNDKIGGESEEDSQDRMDEQPRKSLEDKSATKIQAGIRGFLVRKRQQAEAAAATRIQAGFRGFRTRKLLKQTGQ